jgi:hypothetical protein
MKMAWSGKVKCSWSTRFGVQHRVGDPFPFLTTPHSSRSSILVRCCLWRGGNSNILRGRQAGKGLTPKYGNPGNGLGAVFPMLDRFQVGIGNKVKCLQYSLLGLDRCWNENYLGEGHARERVEGPSDRRSSRFIGGEGLIVDHT